MTRSLPLLGLLAALAVPAASQDCPTGLTMESAPMMCLHVDASCDGGFSLNGQSCLHHSMLAADDACTSAGVRFSGDCLAWADPAAPLYAEARSALDAYARGGSPQAEACASGLSVGSTCVGVAPTCPAGLRDSGMVCYAARPEASCVGTGVRVSTYNSTGCLAWSNPDGAEVAGAETVVARLAEGEGLFVTDPALLPPGFGQLPAHLLPACMDGRDNDGDGSVDYPESGCTSPFDHEETPEAGEHEHYKVFERARIDPEVQRANLTSAQSGRERADQDSRAIQDYWYLQAVANGLTPEYDWISIAGGDALDAAFRRLGIAKRTYFFSDRYPEDRAWRDEVDFAFGWGRSQSLEVNVVYNAMGLVDVRSWGGSVADPTWGPFDGEASRVQVSDPDVRVHEYNRLRSSYLEYFRSAPVFFHDAEVVYLTPDLRFIVQVRTRADSGGNAARMNGPEGWRMVNAPVSVGPWEICTAGELTEPAAALACDENPRPAY